MSIWQVDFYRRPLQNAAGHALWELVVCGPAIALPRYCFCPQPEVNTAWLVKQLEDIAGDRAALPKTIQVFRPQSLPLVESACHILGIAVEPTRHTPALKQLLQERATDYQQMEFYTGQPYEPIALEQPPPLPLPETLWGEQWQFAAIAAGELVAAFQYRPIPILELPESRFPVNLQLPSTLPIPGVIISGGKQSMRLARWLQGIHPVTLNYIPGSPDGLILDAGLIDRWVIATFTDTEAIAAAQTFKQRQQNSKGLHFLLVQPDDSGMTYSGFWLLQTCGE